LLTVTRWDPSRHPFFFLDLAERLKASKMNIVMAGSWPIAGTYERFQAAISKRGLTKKILIVRRPDEHVLTKLFQGARCFVVPPVKGPMFMSALEAGAQGTPIVCSSESSAWDIFTPGAHGFEVDVNRIDDYTESIERFEDDSTVEKMGYSIWKKSHECSWENQGAKLEKILDTR
jgi:glycosyltransferase involved in cell wall biosynthesis